VSVIVTVRVSVGAGVISGVVTILVCVRAYKIKQKKNKIKILSWEAGLTVWGEIASVYSGVPLCYKRK